MTVRKNKLAACVIGGILMVVVGLTYLYMSSAKANPENVNLSVIVYGSTPEKWTAFKQGVQQAASDLQAVVEFVTLAGANDGKEQQEQMEKEIENGAQGLVVAVVDSRAMSEYIAATANVVPIVQVENRITGDESVSCVSADAYAMGKALAYQMAEDTKRDIPVTVVQMGENRKSQQERLAGFRCGCGELGYEIEQVIYPSQESMAKVLEDPNERILAAMDDLELEMTTELVGEFRTNLKLYGIGSSAPIVAALDQGRIKGIVFQNEFNLGYEAVDTVVQKIRNGGAEEPMSIDFHQATAATLHEPENERLLYPIVQ